MLGPYIKFKGTGGTKMSANADLITVETYVQSDKDLLSYRENDKVSADAASGHSGCSAMTTKP